VAALVYVYAVLPRPAASGLTGINSRPVRFVSDGELVAAVSDVPAEDFDEAPLNEHVRDMGWLGPRAVAHQEVNSQLHQTVEATVPLAFGTVFRDDDRVRQLLRDQAPALTQRLRAVQGCAEWVVALHAVRELDSAYIAERSTAIQDVRKEIANSSPGRAHLLNRRLAELERDEARRLRAEAAEEVLAHLREMTVDAYAEPLPTDTVERPLLRVSVLVRRLDEERFVEEVESLRARWPEPGYRLLLTGPWPPYRFAGLQGTGA
jgi:hypothetical protein